MSMIHEITAVTPRNKRPKRKGRGESSGKGKTSGRGSKAAHGGDVHWKPGHEGGQTPLFRRLPKRGFSNFKFESRFNAVNLSDFNEFDNGATVDALALKEKGILSSTKLPVKVLGNGELTKKLTIVAGWYSKSAHEKIVKAGGTAQNLKGEAFAFPKPKKKFIPKAKDAGKKKKQEEAPAEGAAAPAAEAPKAE